MVYSLSSSFLSSQTLPSATWVDKIGGTSNDQGRHVCLDASGNVIVVGRFAGTVDFDPSAATANLVSSGNDDVFVAKYTSAGAYIWAFKLGAGNGDSGEGVTTDASDNVYVTGRFQSTADFDPSAATNNLVSAGNDETFVAKYTSAGAYVWAFKIGGTGADVGRFITYDATGYIYVTGRISNTGDFDPSTNTSNITSGGGEDIFLAKYDANLAPSSTSFYQWAFKIGAGGNDSGEGVSSDGSGNVFVTGFFQNTPDFNPSATTNNLASAGNDDVFIAKYNSAGAYQWAIKMGGTGGDQGRNGVFSSAAGAVYVTGFFSGTADFDPSATTNNLVSAGNDDAFVGKYDGNTGAYMWAFKIGSTGADRGEGIATDASGNVYIDGRMNGTVDFDPAATTTNVVSAGAEDIYLAEYSPSMLIAFAFRVGSTGNDRGAGVAVDNAGNMYITGLFLGGPMDFDPTATTLNLTSTSATDDVFLGKYGTNIFLPIELLSFNAATCVYDKEVCLDWTTATEINNDYFTVERSADAVNYTEAVSLNGAGTSNQTHYYTAIDNKPFNGINYYRLKQTDFDKNSKYSPIITITSDFEVKVQNPALASEVPVIIKGKLGELFHVRFYDSLGRLCVSENITLSLPGNNHYSFDLTNKLGGNLAYLVIDNNYTTNTTKVILD